jgi:fused signal recognition particle receptor
MGLFDRLKESLTKTRENLVGRVARLVTTKATVDAEVLDQLEETLIAADVGVDATAQIVAAIRERVKEERYASTSELQGLLRDEIQRQFSEGPALPADRPATTSSARPYVIMVVGINGVGKTTTIGKLAHRFVNEGRKVVIAAADTFRAAANEQLAIWAERAGAEIIQQAHGADPAAVAYDAIRSAIARGADVVIVDTAGRLHTKTNLMEELKKIKRVMQKHHVDFPHEVLLVIDASTGQNGLQQARQFSATTGVTGLVVTKLDGTAKGGIVLAISREMSIPVRYIGVGERIDDLQVFDRTAFVDALFGTGNRTASASDQEHPVNR